MTYSFFLHREYLEYKDKYKLYSYSDPVDGVTWDEKNGAKTVGERKFYPKIDDDGSIVVPSNYVKELSSQVAAVAYKEMDELDENGQVNDDYRIEYLREHFKCMSDYRTPLYSKLS